MIDADAGDGVHSEPLVERRYAARVDRSSLTVLVCRNERGTV